MGDDGFKKTEEFLAQIPAWESEYKKTNEKQIKYSKKDWKSAPANFTEHTLYILDQVVMEDWEIPYMDELSRIATANGLEGLWEDTIEQVPDESVDGILFDSYPLDEGELYKNHFPFFPMAYCKLRGGGGGIHLLLRRGEGLLLLAYENIDRSGI